MSAMPGKASKVHRELRQVGSNGHRMDLPKEGDKAWTTCIQCGAEFSYIAPPTGLVPEFCTIRCLARYKSAHPTKMSHRSAARIVQENGA